MSALSNPTIDIDNIFDWNCIETIHDHFHTSTVLQHTKMSRGPSSTSTKLTIFLYSQICLGRNKKVICWNVHEVVYKLCVLEEQREGIRGK